MPELEDGYYEFKLICPECKKDFPINKSLSLDRLNNSMIMVSYCRFCESTFHKEISAIYIIYVLLADTQRNGGTKGGKSNDN